MKKIALASIALLVLIAVLLAVTLHFREKGRPAPAPAAPVSEPVTGRLVIRSLADMQVGGKPIVLCGVANRKPAALQPMLLDAARKAWHGRDVTCVPVGLGTPCDGRASATFGRALVVQCMDGDVDMAADLADKGILCDLPEQSGGRYRPCQPAG
ncbi:MAG: hypothetical protein ABTQ31_16435 [Rhizobiaceae bacterium]